MPMVHCVCLGDNLSYWAEHICVHSLVATVVLMHDTVCY